MPADAPEGAAGIAIDPDRITEAPERRRVGRPARITRADITQAVLEIGLADSSMKAVAERLGVSVPGLYHHVRNRQELLMLAAEQSLSRLALPEDRGQHWATWLREWGGYSRTSLVGDPELFNQFMSGALDPGRMVEVMREMVKVLTRRGFTVEEALAAWEAVGNCALGSVVELLRQRAARQAGRPGWVEVRRALASGEELDNPDDPRQRGVAEGDQDQELEARFQDELTTLLIGVAVRRGEDWHEVTKEALRCADQPGGHCA